MKKLLVVILACILALTPLTLTGCSVLDDAIDITILKEENNFLKEENKNLKEQLASLKFELTFPDGIVNEDIILNNVNIIRENIALDQTVVAIKVDNANVTINAGIFDGGAGSANNIAIFADNEATIIINDGHFKVGADKDGRANSTIYAASGSNIIIKGGLFEGVADEHGAYWTLNCQNNSDSSIIVFGGSFINFNPAEAYTDDNGAGNPVNYVAEGYTVECEIVNEGTEDEYRIYTVVEASEEELESPGEF